MILTQKAGLNMLTLLLCFAKFHRPLVLANSARTVWLARYNQFRFSNFVSFPCNLTRFSKKMKFPQIFTIQYLNENFQIISRENEGL